MGGLQENLFSTRSTSTRLRCPFWDCEALFQIEHDPYWNLPRRRQASAVWVCMVPVIDPSIRTCHGTGANTRIRHWRVNHRGSMGLTNGFRWCYPDLLKRISRCFEFLHGFSPSSLNTVGRLF